MLETKNLVILSASIIFGGVYSVVVFNHFKHRIPKNKTRAIASTVWALILTGLAAGCIVNAWMDMTAQLEKLSAKK